jgi:hypothetical protein
LPVKDVFCAALMLNPPDYLIATINAFANLLIIGANIVNHALCVLRPDAQYRITATSLQKGTIITKTKEIDPL